MSATSTSPRLAECQMSPVVFRWALTAGEVEALGCSTPVRWPTSSLPDPHSRSAGRKPRGLRVALVWLCGGFGVALWWLCGGFRVALGWLWVPNRFPIGCLAVGFGVALDWL